MVFSSVPLYLDPPNWQQHQLQHSTTTGNHENQHLNISAQPVPMPQPQVGMVGGAPPIRPNSMGERARMEKIPPPETPRKCPRCDSTNTKFCYFNNYSFTQPRHFCKTCRRYWTHGGTLRNVPVGGGCRRNKRSSTKSSNSSGGGGGSTAATATTSSISKSSFGGGNLELVSSSDLGPTIPGIPSGGMTSFMASLQHIANMGMGNPGLSFGGLHAPAHHPLGGAIGAAGGGGGGGGGGELEFNATNMFPNLFEGPGGSSSAGGLTLYSSDHDLHQQHEHDHVNINKSMMSAVKMEEGQRLNLAKQLRGLSSTPSDNNGSNNQFWNTNFNPNAQAPTSIWTDLSGLN